MVSEYSCARDTTESTDSKDFASDRDEQKGNGYVEEGMENDELVLCLQDDGTSA